MNDGNHTSEELKEQLRQKTLSEQQQQTMTAQQAATAGAGTCPHCGATVPEGCDFCEICHRYIKKDVCPFCGASIRPGDKFCQECGSMIGMVECPVCHTQNEFSFCKKCGSPITEQAFKLMETIRKDPEYQQLAQLTAELERLNNLIPVDTPAEREREAANNNLKLSMLSLLAEEEDRHLSPEEEQSTQSMSEEKIAERKAAVTESITAMLKKMQLKQTPSPVMARNYAMATKPIGVRTAWVCNYKHAMHSSPCACGKPQLGGKWVILGASNKKDE